VKNFVEQISMCCRQAHQNIGKNIGGNSYIGRYSKIQISTDIIGRYLIQTAK